MNQGYSLCRDGLPIGRLASVLVCWPSLLVGAGSFLLSLLAGGSSLLAGRRSSLLVGGTSFFVDGASLRVVTSFRGVSPFFTGV